MRLIIYSFLFFSLLVPGYAAGFNIDAEVFISWRTTTDTIPVITCPSDTVVGTVPWDCYAEFSYTVVASDDQPGWTLSQTAGLSSGAQFPEGATLNQFTVTDIDGNSANCSFTVTVKDYTPPVAICEQQVTVTIGADDPNDCYASQVAWVPATAFDDGSYDLCSNFKLQVMRPAPYSDCILGLNPINGHPDCNDPFPDFPAEFEKAIGWQDSIKFFCCESGLQYNLEIRAYQLDSAGNLALNANGTPIYSACTTMVKVDTVTCLYSSQSISGIIALDTDADCAYAPPGIGIPNLVVKAVTPSGDTLFTTSNQQGYFIYDDLPSGTYEVSVAAPSSLWTICDNQKTITLHPNSTGQWRAFMALPAVPCPALYTDLGTTVMRPCSTSIWTARTCNYGTEPAESAVLQLIGDAQMEVVDVSAPYTQNGDTLLIELGDIPSGDCQDVQISYLIPCTPSVIGSYFCVEAHVFPDSVCVPTQSIWSGAQIEASAVCDGDSVHFFLHNTGTAPTASALDYIVIDDMVVMVQGQLPAGFAPGMEQVESLLASGQTSRLLAQQESNHPLGVSPSVGIENCNGTTFPSLLLAFPNEDGNPFTDLECREVVSSFDPNEKLAFPRGYSDLHFIEPNTPLEYQLNFQNTGTDTAFLVVLKDTLSALLDPTTLRIGSSSHPCIWELSGPGVLTVRFDNIRLPDSTINEPASHGFVRFRIEQKADIPLGSVIENRAGIYFDINPVVLTNWVFHTIGNNFIPLGSGEAPDPNNSLHVYPNPATDGIYVALDTEKPVQLILRDMFGRSLRRYSGTTPGLYIPRDGLPNGVYLLEVQTATGRGANSLVIWHGKF